MAPQRGDIKSAVNKQYGLRALSWVDNQTVSMIATRGSVLKTVVAKRKGKDSSGKAYKMDVACPEIIHM